MFLTDALKESTDTSSIRTIMFAVVFSILFAFIGHNVRSIIKVKDFIDFPTQSVILITAIIAGKVWQRGKEEVK